ncbi:YheC/YheD family protein [Shouchella shacheensis]|uniref:YheC/YheD family protein n=1 Tax=Shouchella shacheensis TaxID=1649580 RepID=UPI001FE0130F|nr:YheC/YheD family protein [Shouchella shacheensis]
MENIEVQEITSETDMLVGFMQRSAKPSKLAKATALMCKNYGMELIYLRPRDVNLEHGTVKGKVYRKNKWVSVEKKLPGLIDAVAQCFKKENREIMSYLRENTVLTFDPKNTPNKKKLQEELLKDPQFSHLVIPTQTLDDFHTLENFLANYSAIIMKPLYGNRGRGLYILRKQGNKYILGYREEEKILNRDELITHYEEYLKDERYLLQKYIESKTKFGDPFDCRVHVQKNRKGKWEIAKIFVRMGLGQKVMSNVHQGGGISDPEPFLKSNFGERWEEINQKLEELAVTLPYKIEELKRTPTMDLGFDVAIDRDGELYLFESNNGAATAPLLAESAMLRVEYYQYLQKVHPHLKAHIKEIKNTKRQRAQRARRDQVVKWERKIKRLQDEKQAILKERDQFKRKYDDIKQSKSWRLTIPVRKVRSLFKRQ